MLYPGASFRGRLNDTTADTASKALGPLIRTMEMAPLPGTVAGATMVSVSILCISIRRNGKISKNNPYGATKIKKYLLHLYPQNERS
jgi:hypothetical protein